MTRGSKNRKTYTMFMSSCCFVSILVHLSYCHNPLVLTLKTVPNSRHNIDKENLNKGELSPRSSYITG